MAMDKAHIFEPDVPVGAKALTFCGIKAKVEVLWADIDPDYPICRDCVDAMIVRTNAVNEAFTQTHVALIMAAETISDLLNAALDVAAQPTAMSRFLEAAHAYQDKRAAKQAAKKASKMSDEAIRNLPVAPPEDDEEGAQ